jgi:hypothetical protein
MDDATGGAYDRKSAQISQVMERIIENGGFHSKKTVMTGDPLDKTGKFRKVLDLRWDTEKD